MRYMVKKPVECTGRELEEFAGLVIKGGQVDRTGLKKRIERARLLGFCYEGDELVGTAAIKEAYKAYVSRVFNSANESEKANEYRYELGWIYTLPNYRRRGISRALVEKLLGDYKGYDLFATTGTGNRTMETILGEHGFQKFGSPFQGRKERKQLYVRAE